MDEPLGALDSEFREIMCEELRLLHDRIGATTVYVTHDQVEAMAMADVIAVMNRGEVLQAGPPSEVYNRPATLFVADFVGSPAMNLLPATGPLAPGSDRARVNGAEIAMPRLHEGLEHAEAVLGARPEHITLSDAGQLRGRVFGVEYTGVRQIVVVDTQAGRIRVRSPNTMRVSAGETVGLEFAKDALILFDRRSERALRSDLMRGDAGG